MPGKMSGRALRKKTARVIRNLFRRTPLPVTLKEQIKRRALGLPGIHRLLTIGPPHARSYREWIRLYDSLGDDDRNHIRSRIASLRSRPLISIIMPVYNAPAGWLCEAIQSVQEQLYPNWELCIADDASTDARIRPLLARFSASDPRIKLTLRETNGHISAASNSALQLASGEFIAFLDQDDLLSEHALYWAAEEINAHPEAKLIYGDYDKLDRRGRRCAPYFKPDWDYDLFLCQNLVGHLGFYCHARVRAIGGFRAGLDGSQDYDLALRFCEGLDQDRIRHIPRVLYHWRMHRESSARDVSVKSYAVESARRAVRDHLSRLTREADVLPAPGLPQFQRIRYSIREPLPSVSLIVLSRNKPELLQACVASVLGKTSYSNFELIIVDNGSDQPDALSYLETLAGNPQVKLLRDGRPFNFSALNNFAVLHSTAEIVGLLNNDVEVINADWLDEMVSHAIRPEIGVVGARLWYPNGTLQHGGVVLGIGGVAAHAHKHFTRDNPGANGRAALTQSFSAVTAACALVRRSIYDAVDGLDEGLAVAFNDVDFCLRVRASGYRNLWTPYAELYHHESASRGSETTPEKRARYQQETRLMRERWGRLLTHDSCYSPNLTLDRTDFSLAWPPRHHGNSHESQSA